MERLDAALEVVARAGGSLSIERFEGFGLLCRDELETKELVDFGLDSGRIRSPQLRDGLVTAVDQGFLSYDARTLELTERGRERLKSQGLELAGGDGDDVLDLDDASFATRVRRALAAA